MNSNVALDSAIEDLKRNARGHYEIAAWFAKNLEAVGITPPENEDHAEVAIGASLVSALKSDDFTNPVVTTTISISVRNAVKREEPVNSKFRISKAGSSEQKCIFDIELPFNEWRCLTSTMALDFLNDDLHATHEQKLRADLLLDKYIPYHFPGLTWKTIKDVHDAGLFILDQNGDIDMHAFYDMLYSNDNSIGTIPLPDVFEP